MRLTVLSDIHDQHDHLRSILERVRSQKPDALILCGDLTRPAVLEACKAAVPKLAFCLGNCDRGHAEELRQSGVVLNAAAWDAVGVFPLDDGGSVAFAHEPGVARRAALEGGHRAVFFGHTHRPFEEHLNLAEPRGTLLANPGDVEGRYHRVGGLTWDSRTGRIHWFEL